MNVFRMFRKYFSPEKTAGAITWFPATTPREQVHPLIVRKWSGVCNNTTDLPRRMRMKINTLATLITFVFVSTAIIAVESCPRGWLSFNSICIMINNDTRQYHSATIGCTFAYGGTLTSVSSEEMLEFLTIHTYSYRNSNFWVGIDTRSDTPKWYDGVPVENQPWVQVNQPVRFSCFIYNGAVVKNVACTENHGSICSKSKELYDPVENCLEGVTEHSVIGAYSGECIYRTPMAMTSDNANAKCAESGGHIMELEKLFTDGVSSFAEHKIMVNDSYRYWTELKVINDTFFTSSGEEVEVPLPLEKGKGECVTVSFHLHDSITGLLYQTECKDHAHAICSARVSTTTPRTTSHLPPLQQQMLSCPQGQNWKVYPITDSCYWETSFETSRLSWNDARRYCQSFGGDLASFHNVDEEKVGLSFQYGSLAHPYWIGLYLDPETETYHWTDGSPLDYQNWAPGHPNHRDKRLRCVAMDADEKHWIASLCGIVSWFVCKAPKMANPPVPVLPTREPNRAWIGLNSLRSGYLRWTDYSPVDFTYWNVNEPNNHDHPEKCVNMYNGNGLWNDENCNNAMSFICKQNKDANVTIEIPSTRDPTIGNCKKGWYAHRDRCYLPVGLTEKDKANWTDASQICQHLGGYLVSIRNVEDQVYLAYLMQSLKDDVWIGFHDTLLSGRYYWVDNSDVRYTNWAPGEPSFFGIQEDCVKMTYDELNSGVWRDDVCSKKLPYICQMDKDPNLPKPDYNRGLDCIFPEGWLKLEDMCFKMFAGNPLTFDEAETSCKRQGGHLVSLSGTSVQAIATYLGMEVNQTYWIGLKYEKPTQRFKWLNKWPMTISKWGRYEPSNLNEDQVCFSSTPDGYWRSTECNQGLPYICQITAGKPPNPKAYTGDCPKTSNLWIPTEGSYCHIYESARADWFTANLRCFRYGSTLISIHSMEELEQIRKTIKPEMQSVLIGLMRTEKGGFSWTDMSPVDFVNWEEFQPDNADDNCVAMMADTLKWRVVSCQGKTHLLCATKKVKEIEGVPESAKYSSDSESGLSIGALAGILVSSFIVVIVVILAIFFYRPSLGRSRFRNPFRQHSVSYENALYNVDSASMEFQEEQTGS
ncbi:macrophage mannose receptor 1 [Nephila pilipes]|uniref:Macrophage mannose receptor 1 n=1 Tax=Nephila pilipes TaxID=299642 RepID=A0A8X6TLL4_NEPPI|nr:macrophage mannose receptor 1 [Nephila pilipes]